MKPFQSFLGIESKKNVTGERRKKLYNKEIQDIQHGIILSKSS